MAQPTGTRPFARFEWTIAGRYLRARRRETFISVIAGFSFIGIMLGVATLIIVMAVMNGFRAQLIDKILGLNGHVIVQPMDSKLTDYAAVADRISAVPGVVSAVPLVEGQALASGREPVERRAGARHPRPGPAEGARHLRQRPARHARQLRRRRRHRHRHAARDVARRHGRRAHQHRLAARQRHAARRHAAHQGVSRGRDLRDRHVGVRFIRGHHAVRGGAGLFQPR